MEDMICAFVGYVIALISYLKIYKKNKSIMECDA